MGVLFGGSAAIAQTTLGLISGSVVDSESGAPVSSRIVYRSLATHTSGTVHSSASGFFILPLLPPGIYQVRVEADKYQGQELADLELAVASFLEINFRLRPLGDVWEQGQFRSVFLPGSQTVVTFFGPDVDSTHSSWVGLNPARGGELEPSMSQVIDPEQVGQLPLAGRDLYTMLVTQPVVSADAGTARGAGLAANGMRPSASNFLLDGFENNNDVSTGPLISLPPEAIQEYRVSTNNYSAEYGRTAGYLANAVTRSGGHQWHGEAYLNWKNDVLNANDFQRNVDGLSRTPLKEETVGFALGGPLSHARSLFGSGSYEFFRTRSQGIPELGVNTLPTTLFTQLLPAGSSARKLLEEFPAPQIQPRTEPGAASGIAAASSFTATSDLVPTISLNRSLGMSRVDYVTPGGEHRLMGRVMVNSLERPDFSWSPYTEFDVPLHQNTVGLAFSAVSSLRPNLTNEARVGWSHDDLNWERPHPEIPSLDITDGPVLPGAPANYSYDNQDDHWEFSDNLLWAHGRHVVKVGAGLLLRRMSGSLDYGSASYFYPDLASFASDRPFSMSVALSQAALPQSMVPDFNRSYRNSQKFVFAEDSVKALSSLVLSVGVRYENFGAPVNTGVTKDALIQLGAGNSLPERLSTAQMGFPSVGDEQLYDSDGNDWAGRFGFSQNLSANGRTLLRGSFGIFYDRPFDNLWQNLRSNNLMFTAFRDPTGAINFFQPASALFSQFQTRNLEPGFFTQVLYQPQIRDPYVESYFFGVERRVSDAIELEVNVSGSAAHKLLTSDRINRDFSVPFTGDTNNVFAQYNPNLPELSYRANQGNSSYNALSLTLSYRTSRAQFHAAYTWSHSIDLQSDPLQGDFANLGAVTGGGSASQGKPLATFAQQFDSGGDRGSSDFDQRQNLVFYSFWNPPAVLSGSRLAPLFRNWSIAEMAAIRSGFPFSVSAPPSFSFAGGGLILDNRADLMNPALAEQGQGTVAGGKSLLNANAFQLPPASVVGNTGRNSFRGPGLFNIDASLGRSFATPWLGESKRITLRADGFNLLNHANLNNPDSFFSSPTFGNALYGRQGLDTGFPATAPFQESGRQIQLLLRFDF